MPAVTAGPARAGHACRRRRRERAAAGRTCAVRRHGAVRRIRQISETAPRQTRRDRWGRIKASRNHQVEPDEAVPMGPNEGSGPHFVTDTAARCGQFWAVSRTRLPRVLRPHARRVIHGPGGSPGRPRRKRWRRSAACGRSSWPGSWRTTSPARRSTARTSAVVAVPAGLLSELGFYRLSILVVCRC